MSRAIILALFVLCFRVGSVMTSSGSLFDTKSTISEDSEHIYLNINTLNTGSDAIPAIFTDNRAQPILNRPEDYVMSVLRYTCPIQSVALFDYADYASTLEVALHDNRNGGDYKGKVLFVSDSTPNVSGMGSPIYSVNQLVKMVNGAFILAYNDLIAAPGASTAITQPPFIQWDPLTQLFSLYHQQTAADTAGQQVLVYFTFGLSQFIPGFPNQFTNSFGTTTNSQDVRIPVEFQGSNDVKLSVGPGGTVNTASPATTLYRMTQEWPQAAASLAANGFRSLLIETSLVPINSENFSSIGQVGLSNTSIVLTDTEPQFNTLSNSRNFLQYQPSIWRMTDMTGTKPLQSVNISLSYSDGFGDRFPIYLLPGQAFSIKIGFFKKSKGLPEWVKNGGPVPF